MSKPYRVYVWVSNISRTEKNHAPTTVSIFVSMNVWNKISFDWCVVSWRYTVGIEDELRRQLRFRKNISDLVDAFFAQKNPCRYSNTVIAMLRALNTLFINPLTPGSRYTNDAYNYKICLMLVNFFCTLFLFVCRNKIKRNKMHQQRGDHPPAVHFMLQTNRKSVQKVNKHRSTVEFYASFK